jgi:integrase
MTIGTYPALSLADAREAWREARQDSMASRDPSLAKRDKPALDFETVSREWLKRDQAKNKSYREAQRVVERELIPVWGHRRVDELGRRDVLDLVDAIADRGAPTMARRVQAYVHRFFRWCVGRGIIGANPSADLPKPGSESKRDRVLSDNELAAVWKAACEIGWPFVDAVRLLILTGARREEIGSLRWKEVAGTAIMLAGGRTKNNEPHDIPLSAAALPILDALPRIADSQLVFTTNGKTPISGWSRAKTEFDKLAGIPPWRIHDLRRTVATGLQRLGASLQVIEAVLGHVSGSRAGVVGVYQRHSFADEKRQALEAWGAYVLDLVEGKASAAVVSLRGLRR